MRELELEFQRHGHFGLDFENNKRKEERYEANLPASIFTTEGKWVTETTIVDRSESGAKLRVAGNPGLPKVVHLVDFRNHAVFECEVRWVRGGHIGVLIIDAFGPARRRQFFAIHAPPKA